MRTESAYLKRLSNRIYSLKRLDSLPFLQFSPRNGPPVSYQNSFQHLGAAEELGTSLEGRTSLIYRTLRSGCKNEAVKIIDGRLPGGCLNFAIRQPSTSAMSTRKCSESPDN